MIITIATPNDIYFDYHKCKDMYNKYRHLVQDGNFDDVIKRTFFFSFTNSLDNTLIGCIYYFYKNDKLFVNAFADRKHHLLNLDCFKKSLQWFDCDIYAEGLHKTSRLCLLKSGFKRRKGRFNVFML